MGQSCNVNFSQDSNKSAWDLYQSLLESGVACAEIDQGYSVVNLNGKQCKIASDSYCEKNIKGTLESEEVITFAMNNYQRFQPTIEKVLNRPIPWTLNDGQDLTLFDNRIRQRVAADIAMVRSILLGHGLDEASDEYKEKMGVALYFLSMTPKLDVVSKRLPFYQAFTDELKQIGLEEYQKYLLQSGGYYVEGSDNSKEYSAIQACKMESGECTEKSKILFSMMFEMAGLNPQFIFVRQAGINSRYMNRRQYIASFQEGIEHVCIGLPLAGRLRLFDPALIDSDARHRPYQTLTLRQYLSFDYTNEGLSLQIKGEVDAAIAAFTRSVEIDPLNFAGYSGRAKLELEKKEYAAGLEDANRSIEIDPNYAFVHMYRGAALNGLGRPDEAIESLKRALVLLPSSDLAHFHWGNALKKQKEFEEALAHYDKAIELDNSVAHYFSGRGELLHEMGRLEESASNYREAIALEPKTIYYYNLGNILRKLNDHDGAIRNLKEAVQRSPKDVHALGNLSALLMKNGNTDEGIRYCETAIAIDHKNITCHTNLAAGYYRKKDYKNAASHMQKAVSLKETPTKADYQNLAAMSKKAGNLTAAIDAFEQVTRLSNGNPVIHAELSYLYMAQGNYRKAVSNTVQTLQLMPSNKGRYVNYLAEAVQEVYDMADELKAKAVTFEKNTGFELSQVTATAITAYAFWNISDLAEAKSRFEKLRNNIDDSTSLALSVDSKRIFANLLIHMPSDMKKDVDVKSHVVAIKINLGLK